MKATAALLACLATFAAAGAQNQNGSWSGQSGIRHVLLVSIDGMHAVDFLNCSQGISGVNDGAPYCPNLASLASNGVNYVAASTSKPSDSFPGLMNIVSGATPRLMGVYYDVAYDRSLAPPTITTGNGVAGGNCTPGQYPGSTTEYEEGIDRDKTKLNGGAPHAGLTDGGIASIDPKKLERDPAKGCAPVYPWEFVRTNTVFGVIHDAGGYTAWSDKHPAYSSVAGRGGQMNLNDYYSPEINSNVVNLPGVRTPTGLNCSTVPDPNSDLTSWTNSFKNIQCYDTLKVNAILKEINGTTHNGKPAQVPTIFGMNFQAVSVGQKLIENGVKGGYKDAAGTPTSSLYNEIVFVDESIGEWINSLQSDGLYDSTLIIITAKHGQSPIDPNLYSAHPGKNNNGTSPATVLADLLPDSESPNNPTGIGPTEDDVSLLWLLPNTDVVSAVNMLEQNAKGIGLGQIYYGPTVALNYDNPGLGPGLDPRTPDIIVTPNIGVTYTGSASKLMEHGGFSHDDTNVMLLVSNPAFSPRTIYTSVGTNQVAPTILKALGLNPNYLDGVREEGTAALPDLNFSQFMW
ncbi:MAG: alkaline phosphatase family protein [Silvibacterium sp.]|nr:alkaline phosphatase family protein [Silvibacterium sp.]